MKRTILFTGGGTAGHVTPNIALMRTLQREGYSIHYIGGRNSIEEQLLRKEEGIPFHAVSTGKLRRYFSLKNVTDAFRVLRGVGQAKRIIKKIKPDVLFSKGGYVSVPAVLAAKGKAKIIIHESDYTPGLSNRIANRYADIVCVTFENTCKHLGAKGVLTGTPIRPALYQGRPERGFAFTGLDSSKPILLVMGGSQGAMAINDTLRKALPGLLNNFQIIHLAGAGKVSAAHAQPGYVQYEYIGDELPDLLAMADIILSRAGANAIFEFLALKKPTLLVPLPLSASRGDQLCNADYFKAKGYAEVLKQEALTPEALEAALLSLYENRRKYIGAMEREKNADGTEAVLSIIRKAAR